MLPSWENHLKAALKMLETEIFQIYSEMDTEVQKLASKKQWMQDINMLVFSLEENAGLEILLVNTERDQTLNAT